MQSLRVFTANRDSQDEAFTTIKTSNSAHRPGKEGLRVCKKRGLHHYVEFVIVNRLCREMLVPMVPHLTPRPLHVFAFPQVLSRCFSLHFQPQSPLRPVVTWVGMFSCRSRTLPSAASFPCMWGPVPAPDMAYSLQMARGSSA